MSKTQIDAIDRLAKRIVSGQVVFLIGAGFSLDSEKNTARRLVKRLLARVTSLAWCLYSQTKRNSKESAESLALLYGLQKTFAIKVDNPQAFDADAPYQKSHQRQLISFVESAIEVLPYRYFEFNEWVCQGFECILQLLERLMDFNSDSSSEDILRSSAQLEKYIISITGGDAVPLSKFTLEEVRELLKIKKGRGKALFLDTMGFHQNAIMQRSEGSASAKTIQEDFGGLVLPRHRVLARLAKEGLCTTVVTTNYDMLIEAAFRMVGFQDVESPPSENTAPEEALPEATYELYARIRCAGDWTRLGSEDRVARILKLHGCADNYGQARNNTSSWSRVARELVFTYREIQNWRTDSWAKELLRTMLRTHTVAFAGYGAVDPVIHNTLRNIYEELSASLAPEDNGLSTKPEAQKAKERSEEEKTQEQHERARAFFFDVLGKREFHALQVLRAASDASNLKAVGTMDNHPNLIPFSITEEPPGLDDLFLLVEHRVARRLQQNAVHRALLGIGPSYLGHPLSEKQANTFRTLVKELVDEEQNLSFEELLEASKWTRFFLQGYLKQVALEQGMARSSGVVWRIRQEGAHQGWYASILDNQELSVVALIVEIALRRTVAKSSKDTTSSSAPNPRGVNIGWKHPKLACHPKATNCPMVEMQMSDVWTPPVLLMIQSAGAKGLTKVDIPPGVYSQVSHWDLLKRDHSSDTFKNIWKAALGSDENLTVLMNSLRAIPVG